MTELSELNSEESEKETKRTVRKVPLDRVVLEGFQNGALLQPSFDLGNLRAGEPQCPGSATEQ